MTAIPSTTLGQVAKALLWCFLLPSIASCKRVSGDFKLSGVYSEHVLTSFAVHPQHGARFQLNLTSAEMYETERYLKLRLYSDEQWNKHLKSLTCMEKIRRAVHTKDITFDYINEKWTLTEPLEDVILTAAQKAKYDPRKVMRNKRRTQRADGEKQEDPAGEYVDDAFSSVEERNLVARNIAFTADRPQYWYFTIDDCMLEQTNMDAKVPVIHFEFEVVNALQEIDSLPKDYDPRKKAFQQTHLSADEYKSTRLHLITMLVSGGMSFLLVMGAGLQTVSKKGSGGSTIHAAVLWVALAAALDASSSFCEILHLKAYERNGYGNYFMDAVSAHLEALCDSLLMLLLVSIGAGWTLPSDAVRFRPNENAIQKAFTDLASPLRALMSCGSLVGILSWGIIVLHAVLCQWGRTYNDDFESYHDLEHFPGKLLMIMRIVLGVLLLAVTWRTHLQAKVQQLQSFYKKLAFLGFAWFQSLPFVTWMCNTFVPYYLRHPAVTMWSAVLQSSSIVLMAWLVTSHSKNTAFAQYSSTAASNSGGSSLNDAPLLGGTGGPTSAVAPSRSAFSFGKTKIAID